MIRVRTQGWPLRMARGLGLGRNRAGLCRIGVAGLCLSLFIAGVSIGCGAARPSTFYQLSVPSGEPPTGTTAIYHASLLVGPLTTSHLYRQDRIVYSTGTESMGVYEFNRWAQPPTEMIADVFVRTLRASGLYESVSLLRSNVNGDFLLRGNLYDFKEISIPTLSTRVTFDLELRDMKSGATVWTHFYKHDEPVNGKSVSDVVKSLDQNFESGVTESTSSLSAYFAAHPPK